LIKKKILGRPFFSLFVISIYHIIFIIVFGLIVFLFCLNSFFVFWLLALLLRTDASTALMEDPFWCLAALRRVIDSSTGLS